LPACAKTAVGIKRLTSANLIFIRSPMGYGLKAG